MMPKTHRIIARKLHHKLKEAKGLDLNLLRMMWGSMSPDILPQYRIYSHYLSDSINYMSNAIVSTIYRIHFMDQFSMSRFQRKIISNQIGVLSHFLSDYVTLPHAANWTFHNKFEIHYIYEQQLSKYALSHEFNGDIIKIKPLEVTADDQVLLREVVKEYIKKVVEEYLEKRSFSRDLDYSLSLSFSIVCFIFETAELLSLEEEFKESLVF